ncbi:potassium/proton antiporter [Zhouia sp. PK063]|uniref:potassium/proton antiporter n=1 Tax=Zhouia sp. PK063 TaxID=3373602 RepID=UPI00378F79B0
MDITLENGLLIGSILLIISIFAGKTSYKFGVPVLLFFLGVGMLAGSEGIGGISFDNPVIAQFIGVLAFNFILFSGGLETRYETIKPVLWQGITLSTLGVMLTAGAVGAFVYYLTDFGLYESLLLGAIISSTDAAAVFSVLRSKNIALKNQLRPTLELESGSNDPMANVLTIVFIGLVLNPEKSLWDAIPFFIMQIILGAALGFLFGYLGSVLVNKIKLDFDALYPVLLIAIMFFTFSATDFVGGNGFLAVYLAGVYLGNKNIIFKKTIIKTFDGYAWLMQIVLFLTLGLLVFPSQIIPIMGIGLLISAFLIFVARPLAVFLSLSFFKIKNRSRFYISWVGLRGASPIVFAIYPLVAGVDKANTIFNIVFFISITSVLIQGTSLSVVANWLGVSLPNHQKVRTPTDIELSDNVKTELIEVDVPDFTPTIGKRLIDLNFPKDSLIVMIEREGNYFSPNGNTTILAEDRLMIMAKDQQELRNVFETLQIDPKA